MPLNTKDLWAYRRDEKLGHKLMTAEERIKLLKPYLPSPPPRTSAQRDAARAREKKSRLGVRRFLRTQLHLFVFTVIHAFFSLYIRLRQAYHAVVNQIYSVYHYHHRTPELIQSDVKGLRRLPRHLSVVLTLEEHGRGGAGLEKLVNEAAEIAAWCASAGIPELSIYEKTGILKGYISDTQRAVAQKLAAYFGPNFPALSMRAPHTPAIETPASPHAARADGQAYKGLSVLLLSAEDGRDSIVDLTKTLTEMSQRNKLSSADISIELVDAELSESIMGEPDLLILFGPHVELSGYPPWQIRLTEIFHVQDNTRVGYQVFYRALTKEMTIFRPPIIRSGANTLNRALFLKKVTIAAAAVNDNRNISKYRKELEKARKLLYAERVSPVASHPDQTLAAQGRKCLLLDLGVKAEDPKTWGAELEEGVVASALTVMPYELQLDYDYWSYQDVMTSILPEELHYEIPTGFNTAGHVAHLNLRDQYLPYKKVVAEVLLDKNPHIKTVINKVDNVGAESQFRTFQYEVLAGNDDLNVQVAESNCVFEFDYAKVYWNSKLETEHRRLVDLFKPGDVVCDVMAGIGPFAVPAGKRGVFVWANDMNPESYKYLKQGIEKNKVQKFVRPFCEDGRTFIHKAADSVFTASEKGEYASVPQKRPSKSTPAPKPLHVPIPPTISHFVMNLPASAIEFLSCYRGVYAGKEYLFEPSTGTKLPMVHVHCFSYKLDDDTPLKHICERITKELGVVMKPGDPENEHEVAVHNVRDVAPAKRMFCASLRIPREVAFAPRD
ncbi:putative undecaprenyl pyrophosphate protein [Podospora aff. communis PSN243]|uniref:tRNA (guanine(37)-N1)-methyltransferase n=1 Tax=Podospora aff. communis PSN243 TaxID=3040156 RepID=A0AAV9GXC8_9PEZI|nr:putative undecaprenyl pyrophosphate protein [Podospora aff. communis PSN243]